MCCLVPELFWKRKKMQGKIPASFLRSERGIRTLDTTGMNRML